MLDFKFEVNSDDYNIVFVAFIGNNEICRTIISIIDEKDFTLEVVNKDIFDQKKLKSEYKKAFKELRLKIINYLYKDDRQLIHYSIEYNDRSNQIKELVDHYHNLYEDMLSETNISISKIEIINLIKNDLDNLIVEKIL